MDKIESFVDQLIREKGVDISEEDREDVRQDIIDHLLDLIDLASAAALPEDKAVSLANVMDDAELTDDQITKYMEKNGVDFNKVADETMEQFRLAYLKSDTAGPTEAVGVLNSYEGGK